MVAEREGIVQDYEAAGIYDSTGAVAVPPVAALAGQSRPVIGFLGSASALGFAPQLEAFRKGLEEAGYVEGRNATIEYRWAEGHYDRLPALAGDLVARRVDTILANGK